MDVRFLTHDSLASSAPLLAYTAFRSDFEDKAPRASPGLRALDAALSGVLLASAKQEGFDGKVGQTFVLHTHGRVGPARLVLLGLGRKATFHPEVLRHRSARAARLCNDLK